MLRPKLSVLASFVATSLVAQVALAQNAARTNEQRALDSPWRPRIPRLRVTALSGAAVPFGKLTPNVELRDAMPTAYLIGGDVAWGPLLALDFGIMAGATIGLGEPDACPQPSSSCTLAVSGQFALRARYYFLPTERFTPWVGLGAGLDVLKITGQSTMTDSGILFDSSTVTRRSSTYLGPLGVLLGGVDFRLRPALALGGLVAFSASPYMTVKDTVNVDGEDVTSSSGSLEPSMHTWLYLAAHITFDARL
jgi:hypothetical protein